MKVRINYSQVSLIEILGSVVPFTVTSVVRVYVLPFVTVYSSLKNTYPVLLAVHVFKHLEPFHNFTTISISSVDVYPVTVTAQVAVVPENNSLGITANVRGVAAYALIGIATSIAISHQFSFGYNLSISVFKSLHAANAASVHAKNSLFFTLVYGT